MEHIRNARLTEERNFINWKNVISMDCEILEVYWMFLDMNLISLKLGAKTLLTKVDSSPLFARRCCFRCCVQYLRVLCEKWMISGERLHTFE